MTYIGHYDAKVWDDATHTYISKPDVGVFITVEETFDNNHRVVAQRGKNSGKFTFSAADSGEHRLCVTPQNVDSGGSWFGGVHGTVKFTLDLAIGETSKIESTDKGKIDDIVQKVMDLNSRLQDIRREQVFQRVSSSLLFQRLVKSKTANNTTGARSRVSRSVRVYERPRRPLDTDSARCAWCDMRMAAIASTRLLHQAEAHLADLNSRLGGKSRQCHTMAGKRLLLRLGALAGCTVGSGVAIWVSISDCNRIDARCHVMWTVSWFVRDVVIICGITGMADSSKLPKKYSMSTSLLLSHCYHQIPNCYPQA